MKRGFVHIDDDNVPETDLSQLYDIGRQEESPKSCFYDYGEFPEFGFASFASEEFPLTNIQEQALASLLGG